ncbi:hypothetical protein CAEBREN_03305 [Caenorhabditis brenneri]|uniref:Telomerase reverse transcriptase n=1 Tax=Caenorhabditis brenneri TaxID=135651 RepID=G0NUX0_CAEBE|nr:hypothetical protein CAEBREN_03305 [Caenorhabditis brenneri]
MEEHDIRKTINRIFIIFDLKTHIGPTNCENILEWVTKTLINSNFQKLPDFVYKEVPIAKSFRAKKVMQSMDPHSKRRIQTQIINNLKAGLCWWTIISLRQVLVPVRVAVGFQNCWKHGFVKIFNREMKDFKERYKVQRLIDEHSIKTASRSGENILKFLVVNNKLRPIVRPVTENSNETIKKKMNWKKVNSLLSWCLESNGITRQTIESSCQVVSNFLKKNSESENLFVYTADITKCFAHIGHQLSLEIIQELLKKERVLWVTCAKGKDERGFTKLFYCSADSKEQLSERVKKKMASKHVTDYTEQYTDKYSTTWLLSILESLLSSYYYKRGPTYFRIGNGVPQGHPLSSLLALMYLADFERKYWNKEKKDPRITYCRYEDDYIFLTTQKEIFEQMIKPLLTGDNTHKLKANMDKSKASEDRRELEWCGVQMDLKEGKFSRRRLCKDGVRKRFFIKL